MGKGARPSGAKFGEFSVRWTDRSIQSGYEYIRRYLISETLEMSEARPFYEQRKRPAKRASAPTVNIFVKTAWTDPTLPIRTIRLEALFARASNPANPFRRPAGTQEDRQDAFSPGYQESEQLPR